MGQIQSVQVFRLYSDEGVDLRFHDTALEPEVRMQLPATRPWTIRRTVWTPIEDDETAEDELPIFSAVHTFAEGIRLLR